MCDFFLCVCVRERGVGIHMCAFFGGLYMCVCVFYVLYYLIIHTHTHTYTHTHTHTNTYTHTYLKDAVSP